MKPETKKNLIDWAKTIVIAGAIFFIFHTYVAEAAEIPSGSMEPTLNIGDRLYIEKISYKIDGLQRGDIVVFHSTPKSGLNEVMIKRVIGLPGDTVSIKNGLVYVNGQALNEPYEMAKPVQDMQPVKVPADNYFMMGDNRNNSFDSRYWGFVPKANIIGKALFRYYPLNRIGVFHDPTYNK